MKDKKTFDFDKITIILERVSYEELSMPDAVVGDEGLAVETEDSYKILSITEKYIKLNFSRKVFFVPQGFMDANVQMIVLIKLDKQEEIEFQKEVIEREIKKRINELMQVPASKASMIIGVITSVSMPMPLITPPYFIKKRNLA